VHHVKKQPLGSFLLFVELPNIEPSKHWLGLKYCEELHKFPIKYRTWLSQEDPTRKFAFGENANCETPSFGGEATSKSLFGLYGGFISS
jgi:hypothetical protein